MRLKNLSLAAFLLGGLVIPARSAAVDLNDAAGRYAISPSGSSLAFAIASIAGKGISGRFARYDGAIVLDGGNLASVEAACRAHLASAKETLIRSTRRTCSRVPRRRSGRRFCRTDQVRWSCRGLALTHWPACTR